MSRPPTDAPTGEWYCAYCDAYRSLSTCAAEYPIVYCPRCNDALEWEPAPGQDEDTAREQAVESLRELWFPEEAPLTGSSRGGGETP